jgi:FKBP-type peptidyl-prolyl cis-trans isomerase
MISQYPKWLKFGVLALIAVGMFAQLGKMSSSAPQKQKAETPEAVAQVPLKQEAEPELEQEPTPASPPPSRESRSVITTRIDPKDKSMIGGALNKVFTPIVEGKVRQAMVQEGIIAPTLRDSIKIKDITRGSGEPIQCGASIQYHYSVILKAHNQLVFSSKTDNGKPLKEKLGAGSLPELVSDAMVGMMQGGKRGIQVPGSTTPYAKQIPSTSQKPGDQNVEYTIELLGDGTASNPPSNESALQQFDSVIGTGDPMLCGQSVSITYTVKAVDGKPILEEQHATFKLGEGVLMQGIEAGVLHMRKGGARTLIIPPALTVIRGSKDTGLPKGISLTKNQVVLVDVRVE